MTRHDDSTRLRHMLDHAVEACQMIRGRARSDLDQDRQLNLALVRLMEIIGEAAGRVSPETCASEPEIPWPDIVSLRNRLIHGYDEIDFDILWHIIAVDLPPLVQQLEKILGPSAAREP
jgi:uncharacterized protein with HEPN domain